MFSAEREDITKKAENMTIYIQMYIRIIKH